MNDQWNMPGVILTEHAMLAMAWDAKSTPFERLAERAPNNTLTTRGRD